MPLEITLNNEQQMHVALTPVDPKGKPAKLDGAPVWTVVDGDATVVAAPDGLSADIVTADDTVGDSHFQVEADADLGAGVITIQDTITLHSVAPQAAALGLAVGAVSLKP